MPWNAKTNNNPLNRKEKQSLSRGLLINKESDVLKELATGKSYKAIGEKLFTSRFTVRKKVINI